MDHFASVPYLTLVSGSALPSQPPPPLSALAVSAGVSTRVPAKRPGRAIPGVFPPSHPEPAPSQREGRLRLLKAIVRRRTPAITTSADSVRCGKIDVLRCRRLGRTIQTGKRPRTAAVLATPSRTV